MVPYWIGDSSTNLYVSIEIFGQALFGTKIPASKLS